ncbi:integrase [Baekduia alba]|uniref:tyrosine-type recombinase/integrase n=1 Tax=Baekduia alba TaxID=2997333 RepID=UPI00233FD607|nr:tyrosine-type recombinase/integrase [Baekduia alba]WCB94444.1 integrase [Baekduia alba]
MAKKGSGAMKRVAEGIYKRGDAYLVPIYHADLNGPGKGGKRWHSLTNCGPECEHDQIVDLGTAKSAKRQLEEIKRRARGRGVAKTVGQWAGSEPGEMPEWLTLFPRKTEGTMLHNAAQVRGFARKFAGTPLKSLAKDEVWEWCAMHPSTVKEIRACLNDAIKFGLLEENPLEHYKLGDRRGRQDIETLTVQELDELLLPTAREEWGDYGARVEAMIEVAAWTGLRPGELFMLSTQPGSDLNGGRVNYVDLKAGFIDVQWQWNQRTGKVAWPKWDSMRQVVLLPRARAAIERLPESADGFLFTTPKEARFTQRMLHYYWDPVRRGLLRKLPESHWLPQRVGEKGPRGHLDFYELRHYFGTALAQPPVGIPAASPYEIMDQMGHKDLAVTLRVYVHVKNRDVVNNLAASWGGHAPRVRGAA